MRRTTARTLWILLGLAPATMAARHFTSPIDVEPQSRLWVSGTSTVRGFECQAGAFQARVEGTGPGAVKAVLSGEKAVRAVEVSVPTEKLDCRNGTMNEHMRKAIKAKEHPVITFQLQSYDIAGMSDGVRGTLTGTLTLGGVQKTITIDAEAKEVNDVLHVTGTHELKMTEFGLKPPTLMMGAMKVNERVKVGFDIVLTD